MVFHSLRRNLILDIDRQYSSSSMSSKSPHSPAFDYRPHSSHTSATSSILFTTSKPPHINSKAAATLGFDFGLPEPQSLPVQPPSPTSTVYEVIDSPTVPDFLLAEDEPAIVDAVRNHLQRPDTSHTQAPAPNYHEAQYPRPQRRNSRGKKTETVFQVDDGDRGSLFWDDNASVFDYYGEILNGDDVEEMERAIMGEEWIQTRQTGQQPSKPADTAPNTPKGLKVYPNPPKSPKSANKYPHPPKSPRNYPNPPKSPSFYPNPPPSPSFNPNSPKSSKTRAQKNTRESLFNDLPPSSASLNVKTNVTILKSPVTAAPQTAALRTRDSDDSTIASSIPYKTVRPIQYESGGVLGLGYETSLVQEVQQDSNTPPKRSRQGSNVDNSPLSQSNYDDRNPAASAISTDPRYITPELHSTPIFPNTPPPSVSPSQNGFVSQPHISHVPDRSLTPPPSTSERRAPTENVIKALKDRIISEPQLISMTATVPTVPIIRMGDHKSEQLRSDSRKTRMNSGRKPRKPMLDDEEDDISTSSPVPNFDRKSQAGLFTRQKRGSPPAVATRGESRRRETTAGSVLFDDHLRDRAQSPPSSRLTAAPEYSMRLPSPHRMNDNPYDPIVQHSSRHRRKVSRQEVDPVMTHSSPAILNQWDGQTRRRTESGFDRAW